MQNNAAVFRTGEVLEEGCEITQEVYDDMKNMKVYDRGMVRTNFFTKKLIIVNIYDQNITTVSRSGTLISSNPWNCKT